MAGKYSVRERCLGWVSPAPVSEALSAQEERGPINSGSPRGSLGGTLVKHRLSVPASSPASALFLPHVIAPLYPSAPLPSWPLTHLSLEHSPEPTRARERVCGQKWDFFF